MINTLILIILMVFMLIGALDRIFNQWGGSVEILKKIGLKRVGEAIAGSGEKFEEGFMTMGALGLAMVGVIALAPVLAKLLGPIVIPVYLALGANPAMFATTLLANDMGGYFLAKELATVDGVLDKASWLYAGLILGSMLGATIVFSIPVAIGIIHVSDRRFLALGVLAGIVTIPLGCIAGGITAMYSGVTIQGEAVEFTYAMIFKDLVPVVLFSAFIILGLWKMPEAMINGFQVFARILVCLITIGLAAAVLKSTLGVTFIPGIDPIFMVPGDKPGEVMRAIEVIGYISCVLLGAYPMIFLVTRWFEKSLMLVGSLLNINSAAAAGLVATLANNIPMFGIVKHMDNRGKVLNMAFMVSAAFTFGDHLGFTAANAPEMIFAVIVGKIVGGITAIFVAMIIAPAPKEKKS